jgi:protein TonB
MVTPPAREDFAFDPLVASLVALAHALALLAWQPMAAPPPRESVLRAVILPDIAARPQAPSPEPARPDVRPTAQARPAAPTRAAVAPEWSDAAPPIAALASPSAPVPALADAGAPARPSPPARAEPGPVAGIALARAAPPVPPAPPDIAAPASLARARATGPTSHAPASAPISAIPAAPSSAAPAPAAPVSALTSTHASTRPAIAVRATESAITRIDTPPVMTMRPPDTPAVGARTALTRAASSLPPAGAEARATEPGPAVTDSGDGGKPATSAPEAPALAGGIALADSRHPTAPLETVSTTGSARLAEAGAASERAAPAEVEPVLLAHAAPGRPIPIGGGGAGGFDSVDYADDNPVFVYPRVAVRLGLQGTVLLDVEVLPDGRAGGIRLKKSSGHPQLDRDAASQMATWRFKPQIRQGRAQTTRVTVPVNYRLDSKGRP